VETPVCARSPTPIQAIVAITTTATE
jgi:hypothetical protein